MKYFLFNIICHKTLYTMSQTTTRKSVEFNAYELVFAISLCDPSILSFEQVLETSFDSLSHILHGCSLSDFENYKTDLNTRKKNIVDQYILQIHKHIYSCLDFQNIDSVFLEGKCITSPQLLTLNKDIDRKHAKADIYVQTKSQEFIGFSIKQNSNCTISNFSLEKIAKQITQEDDLTTLRTQVLKNAGFETFDKSQRPQHNALFYYGKPNPYWDAVRLHIANHKLDIAQIIVSSIFPSELPYRLYEFDGDKLIDLKIACDNICFEEHIPFYKTNKNEFRKAAKLFYKLSVNNTDFRVEIRWKGNIHNASPQYQIHKI